jgi:integrase/recombinase XerC
VDPKVCKNPEMNVSQADNDFNTDRFFSFLEYEKRYSKHTLISYKNDISQFIVYLKAFYPVGNWNKVSHVHIRSWMVELVNKGISPKSINRKISSLKSLYNFLMKEVLVEKNPMLKIISPKMGKRLPQFIQKNNIEKLFDTIVLDDFEDYRNRLIIELMYSTGIRRAELIHLKDGDVDQGLKQIKVLGKGNKERFIPISPKLSDKIMGWQKLKNKHFENLEQEDFLFVGQKGRKLYPKLVYNIVKRYLSSVTTQEKRSPHVLRHSFATHLMNEGADLNAVKDLLGHSNLSATQIYTHNSIEKLKDIYKKAHPKSR